MNPSDFILCVEFLTPPLLPSPRLTLDGLLAGIAFQRHTDWQRAIRDCPVENWNGVPQASQFLFDYPASSVLQTIKIGQSYMRDLTHDPLMASELREMPPKSSMRTDTGPFTNAQSIYYALDVTRGFFIGRGDVDAVRNLLQFVTFIGRQHRKGHGQVKSIEVWTVESGNPYFGVVGRRLDQLILLRPVPLRLRHRLPQNVMHVVADETWHNPYFPRYESAVVEACMLPSLGPGDSFHQSEIEHGLCRL